MNPLPISWIFLKASLFSSGGTGNLPSLHADLLALHQATDRQFAEALTIGQIAPGPNGLWSVSLGYLTFGWPGAIIALIAVTLPPLLVLVVERLYRRVESHPAVEGFVRGLSLAIVGVFVIVMARLLVSSESTDLRALLIALIAAALAATRRIPIVVLILLAGLAGILLYRP